jgi:hypothetical protein
MRECFKIILGVLALAIGASAPTLIVEVLRPGSLVALNPPTPSSRNAQGEPEAHPAEHHDRGQDAQRNSPDTPTPFDYQQATNQNAVAAQPQSQGEGKASAEWWIAFWTFALFLATTGLWFFTALLWWATRKALIEGQEAINAAKSSAKAAIEANKINQRLLVYTNRPKIRVRNISVDLVKRPGYFDDVFVPNEVISGKFFMSNIGGTDAKIIGVLSHVLITNVPLPMDRPYEGRDGVPWHGHIIAAGDSYPSRFQSERMLGERESDDIQEGGNCQIYVMGWILYEDIQGIRRRTAYCRKYDHIRRRFFTVEDPDYEHEE